nr:transposase [Pseudomonas argentinensis]
MPSRPGYRALRRGRASCPGAAYLITTVTRDRIPVFSHFPAGCAAARCFETPTLLRDSHMLAWVLMPDHAHWLIRLGEVDSLAALMNRLKSSSSRVAENVRASRGASGWRAFMITACAPKRICSVWRAISWPIHYGLDWSGGWVTIRSGMRSGFRCESTAGFFAGMARSHGI